MADIAFLSDLKEVKRYMRGLVEMGISPETIRAEVSGNIVTDPLKLIEYTDAREEQDGNNKCRRKSIHQWILMVFWFCVVEVFFKIREAI